MQDEHATRKGRTAITTRQRRQLIVLGVAVFLVALVLGMWSGGLMFAD